MRQLCILVSLLLLSSIAHAMADCPSSFGEFIAQFEISPEFQSRNTHYPLQASLVDGSTSPEPKTVTYKIKSPTDSQYRRVAFPTKQKQAAVPLERKDIQQNNGEWKVKFTKPDTDYTFAYFFKQSAGCWQLVKFEDYSL